MKTHFLTLFGFYFAASLPAQGPADSPPVTKRTSAELGELLGPVALYPDALISLILPASTVPADVVMGARFVASAADMALLESKPWDSSVKALTRYPDTLKWLDDNLEWTAQVGDAFVEQPVEVMESIQALRAKARALGNLVDTPEQKIVQDDADIRIVPAQPEYIYEPRYDPEAVYVERPVAGPLLFFSAAHRIGAWLNYEFDWNHRRLYRGERHDGADNNRAPHRIDPGNRPLITNSREWRPDSSRRQAQAQPSPAGAPKRGSPPARVPSNDRLRGQTNPSRTGVAQPKSIANSSSHGEIIRRAGLPDGGNPVNQPPAPHSNAGNHDSKPNGHSGKGKPGSTKPKNAAPMQQPEAQQPPKHSESPQQPAHKKQSPKQDEPKHKDSPQQSAPKHMEPKHDSPKPEASKPHSEDPKKKGKKNDKDKKDKKD